jgi:hypothetical protein
MIRTATFALLLLTAITAVAQDAQDSLRGSGGELLMLPKGASSPFSGSLGFTLGNSSRGYGATVGATVVPDRLWFFGTMEQQAVRFKAGDLQLPQAAPSQVRPFDASTFLTMRTTATPTSGSLFSVSFSGNKPQ